MKIYNKKSLTIAVSNVTTLSLHQVDDADVMPKRDVLKMAFIKLLFLVFAANTMANDTTTVVVEAVRNHAGGDDSYSDNFTYKAPTGFFVLDYEVIEVGKFGDATYTVKKLSDNRIDGKQNQGQKGLQEQ